MTHCGHVAIIGRPNGGKSTLLNTILQQHISIVTNKPQTTRKRVLGIFTDDQAQIIFIDTPGLLKPRYMLQRAMMGYVSETLSEVDVVCVVVDASRAVEHGTILDPTFVNVIKNEVAGDKPVVLVLNKMDAVPVKKEILPLIEEARHSGLFVKSVAISALENKEVDDLVDVIRQYIPEGDFIYDQEQLSTLPERFFVAELIREVIYRRYEQEIPYATDVNIIEFKERENGKWQISADITVERETQKPILIGKGGEALKQVGKEARRAIETHLNQKISLELFVKVRKDWRESRAQLKNLGY
ncbi:MAG: GTPase Era [Ignavibacteria bacterium]|nr:GTPase Era [Ignavibacteria bacterium]